MQRFLHGSHANDSYRQHQRLPFRVATLLLVGSLIITVQSCALWGGTPRARAASWKLIWSDEFNGSASTGVDSSNWLYDTGTSYPGGAANWGTGEVETMSNSTSNVYMDGAGHLVIKPILSNGSWTSGRIETQRTD